MVPNNPGICDQIAQWFRSTCQKNGGVEEISSDRHPVEKSSSVGGIHTGSTLLRSCHAQVGQTYEGSGNIDLAYIDPERSFAFVVDGNGHNNPSYKKVQDPIFARFQKQYAEALDTHGNFDGVDEAKHFIERELQILAMKIHECEVPHTRKGRGTHMLRDYPAAMAFLQVILFRGECFLLTLMADDCMILIKRGRKYIPILQQERHGIGGTGPDGRPGYVPPVQIYELSKGDEVFTTSDGISEFVTPETLQAAIDKNKDRSSLLQELETIVCASTKVIKESVPSANGRKLKHYDASNRAHYDDTSLLSFVV